MSLAAAFAEDNPNKYEPANPARRLNAWRRVPSSGLNGRPEEMKTQNAEVAIDIAIKITDINGDFFHSAPIAGVFGLSSRSEDGVMFYLRALLCWLLPPLDLRRPFPIRSYHQPSPSAQ